MTPDPENEADETNNGIKLNQGGHDAVVEGVMGEDKLIAEHGEQDENRGTLRKNPRFKEHFTTFAHVCLVGYVVLILFLCFTTPYKLFTWHPALLSLGWTLFMTEAILTISNDNILVRTIGLSHKLKIRSHWIMQTIGASLTGAGFLIVTINKNLLNKYHYTTWHGLLGLIAVVACAPSCLNGVAALFSYDLRKYAKPKTIKLFHVFSGTTAFVFGGLSLILSVYTNWFARSTNHCELLFYCGLFAVTFPVIWTIQRPLFSLLKIMFSKIYYKFNA